MPPLNTGYISLKALYYTISKIVRPIIVYNVYNVYKCL